MDPPFNSERDYNVLYKNKEDQDSSAQITAFEDTWTWGRESAMCYNRLLRRGDNVSEVIKGLREAIGANDMMAYLVMMAIRLVELHRILKPTGSLYLHCDPTASHYLKIILDSIFEPKNFKNEIIWKRASGHPLSIKKFEAITDTILFYWKSEDGSFKSVEIPLGTKSIDSAYRHVDEHGRYAIKDLTGGKKGGKESYEPFKGIFPPKGRAWAPPTREKLPDWASDKIPNNYERLNPIEKCKVLDKIGLIYRSKSKKPYFKRYLPQNPTKFAPNLWTDIKALSATSRERMGYPTQKPIALLERILEASTVRGDVVLDPFCGCGTAIHAAQKMDRDWIGIDVTHLAISLIEYRMMGAFGIRPAVDGVPTTLEAAQNLAGRDRHQFEIWAATRIDNITPNKQRGRDGGIDGRGQILVDNDSQGNPQHEKIIVSVKSGRILTPGMVRDLIGTVDLEGAAFGIFVCLNEPSAEMRRAADRGGVFTTPVGVSYPKIQIYTISDYFERRRPDLPQIREVVKMPPRERQVRGRQNTL